MQARPIGASQSRRSAILTERTDFPVAVGDDRRLDVHAGLPVAERAASTPSVLGLLDLSVLDAQLVFRCQPRTLNKLRTYTIEESGPPKGVRESEIKWYMGHSEDSYMLELHYFDKPRKPSVDPRNL